MGAPTDFTTQATRSNAPWQTIGVIGGGFMGLVVAQRLASRGHAVTVLERDTQLGGLATYHQYGPFFWDRFYHCILPSDTHLLGFLKEVGLEEQLRWVRTRTGYYVNGQSYSMSGNGDFVRFPLVNLWGKIRLAFTVLYCSRINDWRQLENITVEDWLVKTCGRSTYEKFWRPLLLAKLGEHYRRVSAVFIWTYIKRLFSARDTAVQKEHLGYVSGGYKTILERTAESVHFAGGEIATGVTVKHISSCAKGGVWVDDDRGRAHFDKVIFTSPTNVLQNVAAPGLVKIDGSNTVEYLGVVCMVLVTRKPFDPYYVVNIADSRIPFTGLIGMSNLVSLQETAGRYLTYLPKYVLSDDALLRKPDEEIQAMFFAGLRLMFPEMKMEDIESVHINRAVKVQPLQVLNYSALVPQVATGNADFFVLNTAQFVNCTLNNNEVVRLVDEFLTKHERQFASHGDSTHGKTEPYALQS
ncbi:MAG: NAD(P)/FAD-dependent oxidoreductase [Deltaproteobacteria bacterium]|nr:NAD(P)/FAD-dependent oxidoreductase [Deltaproteobacteria bacterium]